MISPAEVLATTDWAELEHAYENAADLPDQLALLLSEDPDAAGDALGVLDAAVLHQGSIYSATAPAARFVASILNDPRTGIECGTALPWDQRVRPLRAALLEWLANVALSAAGDEEAYDEEAGESDPAVDACRALRLELYRAVAPFLDDPTASVHSAALHAAGQLLRASDLAEHRSALAHRLRESALGSAPVQRARIALTLAGWNLAPRDLLADPDPAVRAYAAIAPALDDDPLALAEVRAALRDPAVADAWFDGEEIHQLHGWFRINLVAALLRRTTTFEDVEQEASAVARTVHPRGRAIGLGPMLQRAFPHPAGPLSPAQQRFRAILDEQPEA
ncbi:MAG TPA: hypothetical protein VGJ07_19630 [Rugosimonospora sp.]